MKNHYKKHSGFTLVEMIISMALFAILMTPIYSMIISTMNTNKKGTVKQIASLHGQEVFEEIKSGDVITDKDANGKFIGISKIGDIDISANTGNKTFDDGYEATVTIIRNNSITIDKIGNPYKFNISLNGDNKENLQVNDVPLSVKDLSSDYLNLVVNTNISDDKKKNILIIKDENNKQLLTSELLIDEKNDSKINLTINFEDYKFNNSPNDGKYKKVKVIVFNQCDIPLNIYLEKANDLNVALDNKLGETKIYGNSSENGGISEPGELYDISVGITAKGDKTNTIFTGKTSQNININ